MIAKNTHVIIAVPIPLALSLVATEASIASETNTAVRIIPLTIKRNDVYEKLIMERGTATPIKNALISANETPK
ncbi:MAG: hypothetical protein IPJ79_14520 [Bacteroidetes bacterium]|nr:hypothetical protein [Bacteroidota bacterium]